jgi:hypothetical protein
MNLKRTLLGTLVAATMLTAGGAYAQADNSNSATDPTYYDSYYTFSWHPYAPYWREGYAPAPRYYVFGSRDHYRGPAYYDRWYYYNPPTYPSGVTIVGSAEFPIYTR